MNKENVNVIVKKKRIGFYFALTLLFLSLIFLGIYLVKLAGVNINNAKDNNVAKDDYEYLIMLKVFGILFIVFDIFCVIFNLCKMFFQIDQLTDDSYEISYKEKMYRKLELEEKHKKWLEEVKQDIK